MRRVFNLFLSCWSLGPPPDGLFTCPVPSHPPSCLVTVEVANANLNYSFRCYLLVTMLRCFFSRHAITQRFPAVRLLDNASLPTGRLQGRRCSLGRVEQACLLVLAEHKAWETNKHTCNIVLLIKRHVSYTPCLQNSCCSCFVTTRRRWILKVCWMN